MSKIEHELNKTLGTAPQKDKTDQTYLSGLISGILAVSDDTWEKLSEPAQLWVNAGAKALKAKKSIPVFSDAEAKESKEAATKAKDETAPAKAAKVVQKSNVGAKPVSMSRQIRQMIIKKPTITNAEIMEKLVAAGLKPSTLTVATFRSDTRDTLRTLVDAGMLKLEL